MSKFAIIIIIILFGLLISWDIPKLKNHKKNESIAYFLLMIIGLILSIFCVYQA